MALTNSSISSLDVPVVVVDCVVTSNAVAGGAIGASEATSMEGTVVDIVGMTFVEVVEMSICFNWIKLSNSFSISLS